MSFTNTNGVIETEPRQMDKLSQLLIRVTEWAGVLWIPFFAAWGGAVHFWVYRSPDLTTRQVVAGTCSAAFVSSFAGVITGAICKWLQIDGYLLMAMVGMGGWLGPQALMMFESKYRNVMNGKGR